MNENSLKRRFRKAVTICSALGIIILTAGILILDTLNSSLGSIVRNQMQNEAEEYTKRLLHQIDKDYQTLRTLSSFVSYSNLTETASFSQSLYESNQNNDFITMSYFDKTGVGTLTHLESGILNHVDYRTLNPEAQVSIQNSLEGKPSVSRMFQSKITDGNIFVYSVPVYRGSELIGVLAASDNIEIFGDLLNDNNVLGGSGSVHLVSSSGDMLVMTSSPNNDLPDKDIFHSSHFSKKDQPYILKKLANSEPVFSSISCQGEEYQIFLNPVGIHDWYIMCINDPVKANRTAYQMVRIMIVVFLLILSLVLVLLVYICRIIFKANRRLTSLAYQDTLTGADNLQRFSLNINEKMDTCDGFCLVSLNIRQFKFINEIFGAPAANRILKDICLHISEEIGEGEFFCRESGDLFYLFLQDTEPECIRLRIQRLMDQISLLAATKQHDYQLFLYAGAFIWLRQEETEMTVEMLITRALFAMQYAKNLPSSSNQLHFYDSTIHKNEELANYVETHMQQALEKGEFRLFLQPKFRLDTRSLGGAEALVRWITDDGRMIYPDAFIPQFEHNGFCVKLDMYMVEQVCRQLRAWIDEGFEPIPLSVNQSKLLFYETNYLEDLKRIVEQYQIPTNLITLEILEGLALEHADELNQKIQKLRQMGFRISMDDFGTGYASFNTLGNLEIDELKLDRSFLLELSHQKGHRFRLIMSHIIRLAKSLSISTVAEGVETLENEELICRLGCDFGQGYLYSRPISAEEFTKQYMR